MSEISSANILNFFKRYRVLVAEVIGIVALIFIIVFQRVTIAEKSLIQSALQEGKQSIVTNEGNAKGLKKDLDELNAVFSRVEERLLIPSKKTEILRFFWDQAARYRLSIDNPPAPSLFNISRKSIVDSLSKPDPKDFLKVNFKIQVKGNFNNVLLFMHSLQREKYIGTITELHLENEVESGNVLCSFGINFIGSVTKHE
ncbi:MAG: hypothetical protein A2007_01455 [Verrucomicrobia bacterium GWC2_42_7]|nr:MAG: hypothetical protein A2007_01455 [Verrucomicrobia bacterium GWC2_42_7]